MYLIILQATWNQLTCGCIQKADTAKVLNVTLAPGFVTKPNPRPSHDWPRVEAGVVRNAVPTLDMTTFKKEVTQATQFVVNELSDKQTRVVLR